MITGLAGSLVVASCLGCVSTQDADVIRVDAGPVPENQSFANDRFRPVYNPSDEQEFSSTLKVGNDFSPNNFAQPEDAARFKTLDLSTPAAIRSMSGDLYWSGEVTFSASSERTGLGLDVEFAPRAQIQRNRAGNNIARTGAEIRFGPDLADRDLRRKNVRAPSWYFFVGADNEALVWNVADKNSMDGMSLMNQTTVGDLQAGIAWSLGKAGQMSFGMVERELEFNDIGGDKDVRRKDRFAAFTYSFRG